MLPLIVTPFLWPLLICFPSVQCCHFTDIIKIIHVVCNPLRLVFSLRIMPLRSIYLLHVLMIHYFFYYWLVVHHTDVLRFAYPLTHWKTLGLCVQRSQDPLLFTRKIQSQCIVLILAILIYKRIQSTVSQNRRHMGWTPEKPGTSSWSSLINHTGYTHFLQQLTKTTHGHMWNVANEESLLETQHPEFWWGEVIM